MKFVHTNQGQSAWIDFKYVESQLLQQNPAGESPIRPLAVYMPKEAHDASKTFPVLYCLAPWTSAGRSQFEWQPFKESLFDRISRLINQGQIPPCIVVSPDLYTSFGGSQYINSDFLGRHGDHLVQELIPFVEEHYPVKPGPQYRGVFGRSSGGFGALRLAMDYPGSFAAVACHSGDLAFDIVYKSDLIQLCNGLKRFDNHVQSFLDSCRTAVKLRGQDVHLLMLLGMCASYSPDLNQGDGFEIPIDLTTGQIDDSIWQRWRDHDPISRLNNAHVVDALTQLTCLYVECGNRDQYNLLYGARQFVEGLRKHGIDHHYFEFDDNHSGTSYRYDVSLPLMLASMNP